MDRGWRRCPSSDRCPGRHPVGRSATAVRPLPIQRFRVLDRTRNSFQMGRRRSSIDRLVEDTGGRITASPVHPRRIRSHVRRRRIEHAGVSALQGGGRRWRYGQRSRSGTSRRTEIVSQIDRNLLGRGSRNGLLLVPRLRPFQLSEQRSVISQSSRGNNGDWAERRLPVVHSASY